MTLTTLTSLCGFVTFSSILIGVKEEEGDEIATQEATTTMSGNLEENGLENETTMEWGEALFLLSLLLRSKKVFLFFVGAGFRTRGEKRPDKFLGERSYNVT